MTEAKLEVGTQVSIKGKEHPDLHGVILKIEKDSKFIVEFRYNKTVWREILSSKDLVVVNDSK